MNKSATLVLLLILSFVFDIKAQSEPKLVLAPSIPPTVLDLATIRCQYTQLIVNDPEKPRESSKENIMYLQIGKNVSKYVDIKKIASDSLLRAYEKQGMDNNSIVRRIIPLRRGTTPETIIKNYPENKITFTNYLMASYLYEEDYVSPQWVLSKDTMTIIGYPCKKAITTFRGRIYTAWYAPDIPISEGPWKLKGLPGLILKAEDDKKEVSFECIAIEQVRWRDEIYISNPGLGYVRTTKSAYNKMVNDYMENPAGFIEPVINANLPLSAKKRKPYNPIELSE